MRVVFFGDSVTHGMWDTKGGWVQRLRAEYDKHSLEHLGEPYPDFYNLGINGDTANGLVKRLALEMEARHWFEPPIIVIAIGLNDTMFTDMEQTTTPMEYRGELEQIVAAARQFTEKLLFVGITPVDETIANPWKYAQNNYNFKNERILEFEKVLRDFCQDIGLPLVKVYETFQHKQREDNLLADGLHPNEAGHQLIAEAVKPELAKLIKDI